MIWVICYLLLSLGHLFCVLALDQLSKVEQHKHYNYNYISLSYGPRNKEGKLLRKLDRCITRRRVRRLLVIFLYILLFNGNVFIFYNRVGVSLVHFFESLLFEKVEV